MTETVLWDADTEDANWISELQRVKGRIPEPETTATVAPVTSPEGAWIVTPELAYSPNQPRKSDGKFGTGGASGGASGSSGSGTAGETPEGHGNRRKLWDAKFDEPLDETQLKAQAMKAVGADLDAQFDRNRLVEAAGKMSTSTAFGSPHGDTPGEQMADVMLTTWTHSAYNPRIADTIALQEAVAREFRVGPGDYIQKQYDAYPGEPAGIASRYDMEVMQAGVRSMYKHTQARLDELGVKGDITLHRGVGREIRGEASVDFNAASSWSVDRPTADSFALNGAHKTSATTNDAYTTGTRLTMTVPRERVLSMPGHGIGCFDEGEVVVLRANGDKAQGVQPGTYEGEAIEP